MSNHLCPPTPSFCNHQHVTFLEESLETPSNTEIAAIALALYKMLGPETTQAASTVQAHNSSLWYQAGLLEGISREL